MKPTTEDFLIPFDSALARVCPAGQPEDLYVGKAVELRLRIAIKALREHHEKLQQLADQWVKENKEKLNIQTSAYKFSWGGATQAGEMNFKAQVLWKRGEIWQKMRSAADSIFRDYIPENPPQE
jgi:predicted proteasome-type protease